MSMRDRSLTGFLWIFNLQIFGGYLQVLSAYQTEQKSGRGGSPDEGA